jgi:hypothetical protein
MDHDLRPRMIEDGGERTRIAQVRYVEIRKRGRVWTRDQVESDHAMTRLPQGRGERAADEPRGPGYQHRRRERDLRSGATKPVASGPSNAVY